MDDPIPTVTTQKAQSANVLITSTLRRAIHSVELLAPAGIVETSELFREVDMPVPLAGARFVRLPQGLWLVLARLCWLCGYSKGVESYAEAVARAEKASLVLIEYAQAYGKVAVVGHGWFHRLVGKQLEKKGWTCTTKQSSAHWHACSYTFAR
ncbi:histidine phosphatase family protein [Anoxybacteroides tepidamans]|uniref:histidine phosphatase family protein n=1 Tax=Anoxybacteroides tepidamans TaxID=265948 RepID=UPI000A6D265C|nr:histidine phosphatase family protein [Anoxybacillus tepidamans]